MDWLNSLGDAIKNRLTTPVIGAFFISWVIVNGEFVLTLLFAPSNWKYLEIASRETNWFNSLICPLALTVIYLVVIPWVQYVVDKVNSYALIKRKELQANDNMRMHLARAKELKAKVRNDESYHKLVRDHELAEIQEISRKKLAGWELERKNLTAQSKALTEQLESANTNYHNAEQTITELDANLSEHRKLLDGERNKSQELNVKLEKEQSARKELKHKVDILELHNDSEINQIPGLKNDLKQAERKNVTLGEMQGEIANEFQPV